MLEINKINAKTWSRMGSRASYGQAILALAEVDKEFLEVDFWVNFGDVHDFNSYIYWQNFFSETNYLKL